MSANWEERNAESRAIKDAALLAAWRIVRADRDLPPFEAEGARETLARRINEMARSGERDQLRLTTGAVSHLRQMLQIMASKSRVQRTKHRAEMDRAGA
jgi:hypothetical protein